MKSAMDDVLPIQRGHFLKPRRYHEPGNPVILFEEDVIRVQ